MRQWRSWLKGGSYLAERAKSGRTAHPKHSGSKGLDALGDGIKPHFFVRAPATPPTAPPFQPEQYSTTFLNGSASVCMKWVGAVPGSSLFAERLAAERHNVVTAVGGQENDQVGARRANEPTSAFKRQEAFTFVKSCRTAAAEASEQDRAYREALR